MTSKHEPHEKLILDLLSRGLSYRKIADDLAALNCKTDGAAVYRWLKSRSAKISSRAALINPLAAPAPVTQQIVQPSTSLKASQSTQTTQKSTSTQESTKVESSERIKSASFAGRQQASGSGFDSLIEESQKSKTLLKKK